MTIKEKIALSSKKNEKPKPAGKSIIKIVPRSILATRKDIAEWKRAQAAAQNREPNRTSLMLLFANIVNDALLFSQMENRINKSISSSFSFMRNGKADEAATALFSKKKWPIDINRYMLEAHYYGHSLIELFPESLPNGETNMNVSLIPRPNVQPETGRLYPDFGARMEKEAIAFRDIAEYGKSIIEVGDHSDLGILNKSVPHVLFKRFAQSCWSELCEIYGIPPRVLKTNTQDKTMLRNAESMMRDMGAAAWFIIDETESFEFAAGVSTTGDVYNNLIQLCNNEVSMLVSGAIIGQDTVNGNRSKDQSAQAVLADLVESDKKTLQNYWNTKLIPALETMGIISPGFTVEFAKSEDLAQLWGFYKDGLAVGLEADIKEINARFGTKFTGYRQPAIADDKEKIKNALSFFE